jgi:hypothetical protein
MSPQGTEVISVHLDASVRLWDVRSAQLAHEITRVHTQVCVCGWVGGWVGGGCVCVCVYDISYMCVHMQPITSVCLVPDNPNEIVTNSRDDSLQVCVPVVLAAWCGWVVCVCHASEV